MRIINLCAQYGPEYIISTSVPKNRTRAYYRGLQRPCAFSYLCIILMDGVRMAACE